MSASDDIQDFLRKTGSDTAGYQAFDRTDEGADPPRWGLLGQLAGRRMDDDGGAGRRPASREAIAPAGPLRMAADAPSAVKGQPWAALATLPAAPDREPVPAPDAAPRPGSEAVAGRSASGADGVSEHPLSAPGVFGAGEISSSQASPVPPAGGFGHLFRSATDKASSEAATGKETPLKPLLKRIAQ